jgi:hypothetical protein
VPRVCVYCTLRSGSADKDRKRERRDGGKKREPSRREKEDKRVKEEREKREVERRVREERARERRKLELERREKVFISLFYFLFFYDNNCLLIRINEIERIMEHVLLLFNLNII